MDVSVETVIPQWDRSNLKSFELNQVLVTNEYLVNAAQKEVKYLLSLDPQKLLAGFYDTAGIQKEVTRYGGWENLLIGGHTIGHYMAACVNAYCSINTTEQQKDQLLAILTEIVNGLEECQTAIGTGFIFGATVLDRENIELQFDHVEHEETDIFTQAWVPWYTMHKIFAGLLSIAEKSLDISEKALTIATKLGDWTYRRVKSWSEETRKTVLKTEYGGMNDCLYDLYQLTGNDQYAKAAHAFDEVELFHKIYTAKNRDNVLNNLHANTTIPKFAGALNRYLSFQNDPTVDAVIYREYAEKFWELVVNHHTYMTGGNSEWEHFGMDDVLDQERTECNNETCNAYNMLKMTKKLFMITGKAKYANYYEKTLINSILSSQNPQTGMTTYFQPMATGYFKVYGQPVTKFWCCVGSGMENFSKLGESIYFYKELPTQGNDANVSSGLLVVNQYMSSELLWETQGIKVTQISELPYSDKVELILEPYDKQSSTSDVEENNHNITIALRLPDWLSGTATIKVNDIPCEYEDLNGYAHLTGRITGKTVITVELPMEVKAVALPDCKNVYGFTFGPVVLSALLGTKDIEETTTGVDVTIPKSKIIERHYTKNGDDVITVHAHTVNEFIVDIKKYMSQVSTTNQLAFQLKETDANLMFVPHYSQHKERFGLYWYFKSDIE